MNKAFVKYLCALLLFGLNGIVASRIALSSYEIVFLRTMIGSVLLIVLFFINRNKFTFRKHPRDFLYILLSGFAMGASWMLLYEAYKQIGVSLASLLYYCGPVIVMILSPVIFKEKLTLPKLLGFFIVIMGIIFVNGNIGKGNNIRGLCCGGLSAVMYFFMVTLNKQSRCIAGMENALIQLVASFLFVAVFVGINEHFVFMVPAGDWKWILLLGAVNTGIGCYLYFSSISKLPVQTVAIFGYLELLSAVIFAAFILGERMTMIQLIGAVLIIGGALFGETYHSSKSIACPIKCIL